MCIYGFLWYSSITVSSQEIGDFWHFRERNPFFRGIGPSILYGGPINKIFHQEKGNHFDSDSFDSKCEWVLSIIRKKFNEIPENWPRLIRNFFYLFGVSQSIENMANLFIYVFFFWEQIIYCFRYLFVFFN